MEHTKATDKPTRVYAEGCGEMSIEVSQHELSGVLKVAWQVKKGHEHLATSPLDGTEHYNAVGFFLLDFLEGTGNTVFSDNHDLGKFEDKAVKVIGEWKPEKDGYQVTDIKEDDALNPC